MDGFEVVGLGLVVLMQGCWNISNSFLVQYFFCTVCACLNE